MAAHDSDTRVTQWLMWIRKRYRELFLPNLAPWELQEQSTTLDWLWCCGRIAGTVDAEPSGWVTALKRHSAGVRGWLNAGCSSHPRVESPVCFGQSPHHVKYSLLDSFDSLSGTFSATGTTMNREQELGRVRKAVLDALSAVAAHHPCTTMDSIAITQS
jgi:hypothetical protein